MVVMEVQLVLMEAFIHILFQVVAVVQHISGISGGTLSGYGSAEQLIIVAAGGAGQNVSGTSGGDNASSDSHSAGMGTSSSGGKGGTTGTPTTTSSYPMASSPATSGSAGSFGKGGNGGTNSQLYIGSSSSWRCNLTFGGAGGGGGLYGGGGGAGLNVRYNSNADYDWDNNLWSSAGGGASYVSSSGSITPGNYGITDPETKLDTTKWLC